MPEKLTVQHSLRTLEKVGVSLYICLYVKVVNTTRGEFSFNNSVKFLLRKSESVFLIRLFFAHFWTYLW